MRYRYSWAFLFTLVLLPGCGGPSMVSPPGEDTDGSLPQPNPITVNTTVDTARAVTQTITVEGGIIAAAGADGTAYMLSVPENAVLEDTSITLTPVLHVSGFEVEGAQMFGVELQPHGLEFFEPAQLTITSPGVNPATRAFAFAHAGEPKEFYLYPLDLDTSVFRVQLMHFSSIMIFTGDGISLKIPPRDFRPSQVGARFSHDLADILREMRERVAKDETADVSDLSQRVVELMRSYYTSVITPILGNVTTNCAFYEKHQNFLYGWVRNITLLGVAEELHDEVETVLFALNAGLLNCLQMAMEPCINSRNTEQVQQVLLYVRAALLRGLLPESFNIGDPTYWCDVFAQFKVEYDIHDETAGLRASGTVIYDLVFPDTVLEEGEAIDQPRYFKASGSGTYLGVNQVGPHEDDLEYCIGQWGGWWMAVAHMSTVLVHEDGSIEMSFYQGGALEEDFNVVTDECDNENLVGMYRPWEEATDEWLEFAPGSTTTTINRTIGGWLTDVTYTWDFRGILPPRP